MQFLMGLFVGLLLSVCIGAEPLLEGQVRLSSGQPAVGVQVRLFDLTNLHQSVGTTTDETGHFTLSLPAAATRSALPQGFALGQNYPNPFNPSTIIPYQIPTAAHVRLAVFNLLGQRIATLVDAERAAGMHTAQWDATDAAGRAVGAGVYIYQLSSDGMKVSRRMVLIDGQAGIPAAGAAGPMPIQASALERVEADAGVYGLTVSGEGLVAYVNPAFRVGVDEVEIVVAEHSGRARMKRAAGGILGDVDNNERVDFFDALLVALYSGDASIVLPNNGDISLGDVNGDGRVDLTDAWLIAMYLNDPSGPTLPSGIGEPVGAFADEYTPVDWITLTDGGGIEITFETPIVRDNADNQDSGRLSYSIEAEAGSGCYRLFDTCRVGSKLSEDEVCAWYDGEGLFFVNGTGCLIVTTTRHCTESGALELGTFEAAHRGGYFEILKLPGDPSNTTVIGASRWQHRVGESEWLNVEETVRDGVVCGNLLPDEPGEYRWVVHIEMEGQTESYASANTLVIKDATSDGDDSGGACFVGQELSPSQSCTFNDPGMNLGSNTFRVTSDGKGCVGNACAGRSMLINTFVAQKIPGTSNWRIISIP